MLFFSLATLMLAYWLCVYVCICVRESWCVEAMRLRVTTAPFRLNWFGMRRIKLVRSYVSFMSM